MQGKVSLERAFKVVFAVRDGNEGAHPGPRVRHMGAKGGVLLQELVKCDTDNCEDSAFDAGEQVVHPLSVSSTKSD